MMKVIIWVCANSDVIQALVPPTELSPEEIDILPLERPHALRMRISARKKNSGRRKVCLNSTPKEAARRRKLMARSRPRRTPRRVLGPRCRAARPAKARVFHAREGFRAA